MKEIIVWSNSNQGFISMILSTFTLLVSIISVFIAIKSARLPYKKKLLLTAKPEYYEVNKSKEFLSLYLTATNIGNRPVSLNYLGLSSIENGKFVKLTDFNNKEKETIIKSAEMNTLGYQRGYVIDALKDLKDQEKIYVLAIDHERKKYRKYIGTAKEIIDIANTRSQTLLELGE